MRVLKVEGGRDDTDEGERVREVRQDLLRLLVRKRHAQEVRLRHVWRLRALDRHVHHVRDAQPLHTPDTHTYSTYSYTHTHTHIC